MIFLLLGIAMGLFAIVLLLFGFASTGLTRETICDGTKCIRSGVSCAVLVSLIFHPFAGSPRGRICTKFVMGGCLPDVIACDKFLAIG